MHLLYTQKSIIFNLFEHFYPIFSHRMWPKQINKLSMAAQLVRNAMDVTGDKRDVYLCCDSWYPKGDITKLPDDFSNLTLICNARCDSVLYDLPEQLTQNAADPECVARNSL